MDKTTSNNSNSSQNVNNQPELIGSFLPEAEMIKRPAYLVENLIDEGSITILNSDSGVGKTTLSMCMAFSVALGRDFLGMKVKQAPTMFVNVDMDDDGVVLFIEQVARGLAKNKNDFDNNVITNNEIVFLTIGDFDDVNIPSPDFHSYNEGVKEIENIINQDGVKLCVIDPLTCVTGYVHENLKGGVLKVMRNIQQLRDRTGCAFIFLHHTGKDQNPKGRGAFASIGKADNVFHLKRDKNVNDDTALIFESVKTRFNKPFSYEITAKWEPRLDDNGNPEFDENGDEILQYKCSLR